MFDRRALLLGLLSCPVCAAVARADEGPAWNYDGDTGPTKWGGLDPSFKTCAAGTEQSPIDLTGAIKADIGALKLNWKPEAFPIVNNGHTI